ncbi:cupin domain-containing protein [Clostridium lacusfryxellense]|uniref:cupin domain-containing protein n=1 Tax=Clostridium lacusfryxellense TaxID=205328 RepID=UPI001C0E3541|nr:cupin domain-containing protein [Clostridium lacusfryxellense]MBU3112199.1 cupin domain-containing protein [Clostridium lacusfryxellense]
MIVRNDDVKLDELGKGVSRKVLAHVPSVMMVQVNFIKGAIGEIHEHVHEQISYIIKGSFEVSIDGKKEIVKAGDTFYVKPNALHGVVAQEDSTILDVFTPQREDFL